MVARLRDGWDVYEIARLDDPHPVWAELRESDPVHEAGGKVWLVTRHDLAEQVLRDPRLRAGAGVAESFGEAEGLLADVMAAWLMSLDGEAHQYARNLVSREFTPRRIAALAPLVESLARELTGAWLERALREPADLVEALAFALPSRVMCHLFRIDPAEWRERVEPLFRPPPGSEPQGGPILGLAEYFDELLRAPDDIDPKSLLALLAVPDAEAGELSDIEVVANCVLLVTAGIDTTAGLIANTVLCLLKNPEQLALVRADPELVPAAIEETLRFEPPALSCSRHAPEGLTLGGHEIPAGSQVLVSIAAANRDPRCYPDPDRFDVTRAAEPEPLTFGGGRHFCLGAALARLEGRAALEALLETGCDLELDSLAWRKDNPTVRAPSELRVRARRRA